MKTLLPWVMVGVLSVLFIRTYLTKQRLESQRISLAATAQAVETNTTRDSNAQSGEVESLELKSLRKDREDLLRLRNEVRQLRESNQQLEKQAKAAAAENAQQQAVTGEMQVKAALQARRDKELANQLQPNEPLSPPEVPGGTVGLMLAANGTNPGQLIVNRVATNSPAGRAGIPSGARLISINGVPMEGSTIAQSVQLIRGDEGTQVIIEYEDPQSGVRKQVALTREKVSWGLSN
jgi:C-terminal processing protease CtpA/Prc